MVTGYGFHDVHSNDYVVDLFQHQYCLANDHRELITTKVVSQELRKLASKQPQKSTTKNVMKVRSKETSEKGNPQQRPMKRRKLEQLDDMSERHNIKELDSTREKLEVMCRLWKQKKFQTFKMTGKAKVFVSTHLKPIMQCLENHFEGNVNDFCKKYPNLATSTFTSKCCTGDPNATTCTPKNKREHYYLQH